MSILFDGRRRYVERSCDRWFILSAGHGLVDPETVLAPYDVTLKNASRAERRAWSLKVLEAIEERISPAPGDVFEIHAGHEYRAFGLEEGLRAFGSTVEVPTQGLPIGKQLQFYRTSGQYS